MTNNNKRSFPSSMPSMLILVGAWSLSITVFDPFVVGFSNSFVGWRPTTAAATTTRLNKHLHASLLTSTSFARKPCLNKQLLHAVTNDGNEEEEGSDKQNPALQLTNTLQELDRQWKIQQRSKPSSRWTKLVLENVNDEQDEFVATKAEKSVGEKEFVYLLEPPNQSMPSCIIVFYGGAGLGTYPQIAYNELLLRLSNRLNAAIVTAPYQVGLDHFQLSQTVGELHRRAVLALEEDPTKLYPPSLPTYCLAHSLGGKLATIYMAATGLVFDGVGLIAFNNFGFGQTITMAKDFADQISQSVGGPTAAAAASFSNNEAARRTMDTLFGFAETLLETIGLEFSPSPRDTQRIIAKKYTPERQAKTRLFCFDDDTLDSSASFVEACQEADDASDASTFAAMVGPDISALPGTHLTPVYFKFSIDELPEEAREMARGYAFENAGGFESASFGDEAELNLLVDEVSRFVLGQEPTRKPSSPLLTASDATKTSD